MKLTVLGSDSYLGSFKDQIGAVLIELQSRLLGQGQSLEIWSNRQFVLELAHEFVPTAQRVFVLDHELDLDYLASLRLTRVIDCWSLAGPLALSAGPELTPLPRWVVAEALTMMYVSDSDAALILPGHESLMVHLSWRVHREKQRPRKDKSVKHHLPIVLFGWPDTKLEGLKRTHPASWVSSWLFPVSEDQAAEAADRLLIKKPSGN